MAGEFLAGVNLETGMKREELEFDEVDDLMEIDAESEPTDEDIESGSNDVDVDFFREEKIQDEAEDWNDDDDSDEPDYPFDEDDYRRRNGNRSSKRKRQSRDVPVNWDDLVLNGDGDDWSWNP